MSSSQVSAHSQEAAQQQQQQQHDVAHPSAGRRQTRAHAHNKQEEAKEEDVTREQNRRSSRQQPKRKQSKDTGGRAGTASKQPRSPLSVSPTVKLASPGSGDAEMRFADAADTEDENKAVVLTSPHVSNGDGNCNGNGNPNGNGIIVRDRFAMAATVSAAEEKQWLGPNGMIDRGEYVRLIEQALVNLGYHDVAMTLEKRSGITLEESEVSQFREAILHGHWRDALAILTSLPVSGQISANARDGEIVELDSLESPEDVRVVEARFLILEQHYLELLEKGEAEVALELLRSEISPLFNLPGTSSYEGKLKQHQRVQRQKRWHAGSRHVDGSDGKEEEEEGEPLDPNFLGGARHLHNLTALLMCGPDLDLQQQIQKIDIWGGEDSIDAAEISHGQRQGGEHLRQREGNKRWLGSTTAARHQLLRRVETLLPARVMLPEARLEVLVEQALQSQVNRCIFHNAQARSLTLLSDYKCGPEQLPTCMVQIVEKHEDEVWHLKFSHSGRYLATASKDGKAIIWEVVGLTELQVRHVLVCDAPPLAFVCWSPDDTHLVTCAEDVVFLWDTATGSLMATMCEHQGSVTAAAWLPDGKRFITGGLDRMIYVWDLEGCNVRNWKGTRINDLAVSSDGKTLVTICMNKKITLWHFEDGQVIGSERHIAESDSILSLCLSSDSRYLLVNLSSQEIHLWDLANVSSSDDGNDSARDEPSVPLQKFRCQPGGRQGRYVTRSCFGGSGEAFVVSGGEDSQIYLWHRDTGNLLEVLSGHSGTVNAVSWNPTNPFMFASASDDHTVRLWVAPSALADPLAAGMYATAWLPDGSGGGSTSKSLGGQNHHSSDWESVPGEGGVGLVGRMSRNWAAIREGDGEEQEQANEGDGVEGLEKEEN